MAHLDEMDPDVRAMRIRRIRERIKKGESLTDDEEKLYRESKRRRWR